MLIVAYLPQFRRLIYHHEEISQDMYVSFFTRRECVPPTWRWMHFSNSTLRFGRRKAAYSLPVCIYSLLQFCCRRITSPVTGSDLLVFLSHRGHVRVHPSSQRPALCQSVVPLCSMLLRPDLQYAFAHRGTLPMGRVLMCVGPWAPAPVWSGCKSMCVVFPAPCSSVRGLLTACPVTTAVYFTSVCTNWTLIARFLQLGQIRPQLWLRAAHGETLECWDKTGRWVLVN